MRVQASEGFHRPGEAVALTFADIEYPGEIFYGVDDGPAHELAARAAAARSVRFAF